MVSAVTGGECEMGRIGRWCRVRRTDGLVDFADRL